MKNYTIFLIIFTIIIIGVIYQYNNNNYNYNNYNLINIEHKIDKNYPKAIINTKYGDIICGFFPDIAPITSNHIINLIKKGYYNNTQFGRIEPGFVIQTDICKDKIKCLKNIKGEFSNVKHQRGILSMGRLDHDINSNTSSFSILCGPAPHLDGQYTIFGKVLKGNDVIKTIENNKVPVVINKITLNKN
tara:strand:- start:572 stop:1138 length:567 start_codon:yes stop_codon:yes gene_type:complete